MGKEKEHHRKIAWCCDKCNWLQVSDTRERHTMDTCKCGYCAVDLELGYSRWVGNPRLLAVLKDEDNWKIKITRGKKVKEATKKKREGKA